MRIAGPILLVTTPIGVAFGLREAWRLAGPKMALLMVAMLAVVSALVWWTVQRIRQEQALRASGSRIAPAEVAPQRRLTSQSPARHSTMPIPLARLSRSRNTSTPIPTSSIAAAVCVMSAPRLTAKPLR